MVGSASYLFRVGASIYADEWLKCQRRITAKWSEVHVSPLIPILRENCPGSLSRDIIEIATWFAKSYADNTAGLLDTWAALIQYVSCNSVGSIPLPTCDIVKISLPDSLTSQTHYAHHFSFSSSCPAVLLAQDSKTTDELLLVLIHTINRDFSVGFDPGDKLARSPIMAGHSMEKHLVVVGASHMKRIVPLLTAAGFTVTDMSQSGWVASAENIDKLVADLSKLAIPTDFVAIFDLLGNASFRFKQYDGSQSLPYKTNHGYHLAGDVEVVNDSTYESLINSLLPIFRSCQNNLKVIVPPLPRFLFNGCCNDKSHCANLSDPGHSGKLLQGVGHLRAKLKQAILKSDVTKFWVLDGIGALLGDKPGDEGGGSLQDTAEALEKISLTEGVHYNRTGYSNLCKTLAVVITNIEDGTLTKCMSNCAISGQQHQYYWRGFISPVGAGRPEARQNKMFRGGRHHPYKCPPKRGNSNH